MIIMSKNLALQHSCCEHKSHIFSNCFTMEAIFYLISIGMVLVHITTHLTIMNHDSGFIIGIAHGFFAKTLIEGTPKIHLEKLQPKITF